MVFEHKNKVYCVVISQSIQGALGAVQSVGPGRAQRHVVEADRAAFICSPQNECFDSDDGRTTAREAEYPTTGRERFTANLNYDDVETFAWPGREKYSRSSQRYECIFNGPDASGIWPPWRSSHNYTQNMAARLALESTRLHNEEQTPHQVRLRKCVFETAAIDALHASMSG